MYVRFSPSFHLTMVVGDFNSDKNGGFSTFDEVSDAVLIISQTSANQQTFH